MNKLLILFLFCLPLKLSLAQNSTGSPYSFYGIGDPISASSTNYKSMSGAQTSLMDPAYINLKNVASYAGIEYTTFSADFTANWLKVASPSSTQNISQSYINGVAFGFPMGKRFGAAFSMTPFTHISYDIVAQETSTVLGDYESIYKGEGGYNLVTGGIGAMPIMNNKNKLSLGIRACYYFGFSQTSRGVANFADNANVTSSKMTNRTDIKDLAVDLGIIYKRRIAKNSWISLGASYKPTAEISAANQQLAYTYRPAGLNETIKDVVQLKTTDGNITLPSELNLGLSFSFSDQLTLSFDYSSTAWSELELISTPVVLSDRTLYAAGFQYVKNNKSVSNFFESIRYRGGVRYIDTRLVYKGNQLRQIAATGGLGIPLQKTKMKSTLNFGIEVGNRGQGANTLVKETYTQFFVGLSMNPHKFDGWFRKSKYK